jgi:hypothetical protein
LSYNKDITDDGILYLCGDSKPFGRCLKIKSLNLEETSVNHLGVFTALSNLPYLETLTLTSFKSEKILLATLLHFVHIYKVSKNLQLKSLTFDDRDSQLVNNNLEKICQMLPNVSEVEFITDDLKPLYSFPNLNSLMLYTAAPDLSVANLIAHLGPKLIDLCIQESSCTVDLSVIGHFCPNIEKINLNCMISETSAYEILPCSFQKLEEVTLYPDTPEHIVVSAPVLTQMLSSKFLKELRLFDIPEQMLLSLISQARDSNTGIFSNLNEVRLFIDFDFAIETLLEFICLAPNLKTLSVSDGGRFNEDGLKQVKKFAVRNNLDIDFSD